MRQYLDTNKKKSSGILELYFFTSKGLFLLSLRNPNFPNTQKRDMYLLFLLILLYTYSEDKLILDNKYSKTTLVDNTAFNRRM